MLLFNVTATFAWNQVTFQKMYSAENFQTIDHILCLNSQEYPGNDITLGTSLFNLKLQKGSTGIFIT